MIEIESSTVVHICHKFKEHNISNLKGQGHGHIFKYLCLWKRLNHEKLHIYVCWCHNFKEHNICNLEYQGHGQIDISNLIFSNTSICDRDWVVKSCTHM